MTTCPAHPVNYEWSNVKGSGVDKNDHDSNDIDNDVNKVTKTRLWGPLRTRRQQKLHQQQYQQRLLMRIYEDNYYDAKHKEHMLWTTT